MKNPFYLIFIITFILFSNAMAQNESDYFPELAMFYESDLTVDAYILKYDTDNVSIEIIEVLRDQGFGIKKGDHLNVKKRNTPECGFMFINTDQKRARFYLQKDPKYWSLLKLHPGCINYITYDSTYIALRKETIVLPVDIFNRSIKEFQNVYGMDNEKWNFYAKVPDKKIKFLTTKNPIIAVFEKENRSILAPEPNQSKAEDPKSELASLPCVFMEEKPSFQGENNLDSIQMLVQSYVHLPGTNDFLEGKVYVQFEISDKGTLGNIEIKKGLRPDYDKQAIEALNFISQWQPALFNKVRTSCYYILPISFKVPNSVDE